MNRSNLFNSLNRSFLATIVTGLSLIPTISAALEELGVLGSVEPARPYYEKFLTKSKDQVTNTVTLEPKDQSRIDEWTAKHSTYDSGLIAGPFAPIPITENQIRIVQTLCLVANDDISINWLKKHRANLEKIKPVCYLVRKSADNDLLSLQAQYPLLTFVAVNPKNIIDTYDIPNYPALLSKQGIEQ